jgi:tetratricopeptide (TPR) repeat protein
MAMQRVYYLIGWGFVAVCCAMIARAEFGSASAIPVHVYSQSDGAVWFRRMKPYCNSVEIDVMRRNSPAPKTVDGAGYEAACYALAGRTDNARRIIDALAPSDRYRAAGIVFEVGHPVADAGDDRAAGPIMELVIDYWPNHYMALYHAGMAEYMLGQRDLATRNLTEFLGIYNQPDGWRSNAIQVLDRMRSRDASDLRRPLEPR